MKKFSLILVLLQLLFLSCSEEENNIPDNTYPSGQEYDSTLNFIETEVSLTPNKLEGYIEIQSNIDFKSKEIEGDNYWLDYSINENLLHIKALPNNEEKERMLKLVIYNEKESLFDTLKIIQPINKERIALIKIYKSLNGDKWTNKDNWCSNRPIEEWNGVYANGDMNVYRLALYQDAFIEGEIPDCIGDLMELEILSLENTNIGGKMPESIGKLVNLEHIDISNCQFKGEIPESIKNCNKLTHIDFNNNDFEGKIPESFFQCSNLEYLSLNGNNFDRFEMNESPNCHKLESFFISNHYCPVKVDK